jgi:hypothetical protein
MIKFIGLFVLLLASCQIECRAAERPNAPSCLLKIPLGTTRGELMKLGTWPRPRVSFGSGGARTDCYDFQHERVIIIYAMSGTSLSDDTEFPEVPSDRILVYTVEPFDKESQFSHRFTVDLQPKAVGKPRAVPRKK